ncbi:AAA family ATPase [Dactylosporangium sp. NPDC048998]|uniref:AAA family ATPase n=1 Tax=Dactylosporangium sp. NPDC048998 TaxID=3363976 RepID=UPI00371A46FA
MTSALATLLLAEFDDRFRADESDEARDIALHADSFEVQVEARDGVRTLRAFFDSGFDAARAAIEMVTALDEDPGGAGAADPAHNPAARRWGMRIALCAATDRTTAPARAAQLLARTGRGQILVTAPTAILVGATLPRGADLLYHGVWTPAQDRRPERVYELCLAEIGGDSDATSNLHWARRAVETEAEATGTVRHLGTLLKTWQHGTTGHLRMVLVSGGSGAARTAVCAELALRVHADDALVLYGRWDESHPDDYRAFREALGFYANGCGVERLRTDLDGRVEAIVRLLPEAGVRIGVPWTAEHGDAGWPWDATAQAAEALGGWLAQITARRPTLLVLDELQWADAASVRLLTHLWHACGRRPLTVLMTSAAGATDDERPTVADRLIGSAAEVRAVAIDHIRL